MTAAANAKTSTDPMLFFDSLVSVEVSQASNADGISVLEHRLPFDMAPPLHVHDHEDEIFHIIEGEIRFLVGGETRIGRAGDTLLAPRGVPHAFRVVSPGGARALSITRGGFEQMVRQVSRPAPGGVLPPMTPPTPEMQAAAARAGRDNGIELLGPPIS